MNKKEPCLLPWVELHLNTMGQLKTCCAQFDSLEVNSGLSFSETFNGPNFKKIREEFLMGKVPSVCAACIKAEENQMSYKTIKSPQWNHYAEEILSSEGQNKKIPIRFLDLRFGNLCNFACRTCNSENSSKWVKIDSVVDRKTLISHSVPKGTLLKQVLEVIDQVEEIYFAGGEPLLNVEHYLILEEIIKRKKTSIKITYNTNLSVLGSHSRHVLDLWKDLENVIVYPSIDSIGSQGEYIRAGLNWKHFEENFNQIKKYVGGLQCVLSAYNVFSVVDLILWAHKNGTFVSIFPAYHPEEISAAILPDEVRKEAAQRLSELVHSRVLNKTLNEQIDIAVNFLLKNSTPEYTEKFIHFNQRLDLYHGTNFLNIFPEHKNWVTSFHGTQARKQI